MKSVSYLLLSLLLPMAAVSAQTPETTERPVLPPGPLFNDRAPEFSRWVVSISAPKANTQAAGRNEDDTGENAGDERDQNESAKYSVTKTKNIYHVRIVDAQRQVWDVWSDGKITAREPGKSANAAFVAPPASKDSSNPLWVDFTRTDFDGFGWISADNFRGLRKFQGKDCLIFSDKVMLQAPSDGKDGDDAFDGLFEETTACIDLTTRLPVALIRNGVTTKYSFRSAPTGMQTLPRSIKAMVEKRNQLRQSLNRR